MSDNLFLKLKPRMKQVVLSNCDKSLIILHKKKFLQPFETKLAIDELKGLGIAVQAQNEKSNIFSITLESEPKSLLSKLTYFDWFVSNEFQPTLQACREGANPFAVSEDKTFPKRRILRFGPHDFHAYRGKFFPQLVRSLCNIARLEENSNILDPMCGSGTTIVEAKALDLCAFGLDRNPLSILIADVKASSIEWDFSKIEEIRKSINKELTVKVSKEIPWNSSDYDYLIRWFHHNSLIEIAGLISRINNIPDKNTHKFASVCLSDIVRQVSFQKEEDLRVRKVIRPYQKGTATKLFLARVDTNLKSIERLNRVDHGHNKPYHVIMGDAKTPQNYFRSMVGKFDAIITSPPYATALPYIDTDRLSLIILGMLSRINHKEIELQMIGTREITEKQREDIWAFYLENRADLPLKIRREIKEIANTHHNGKVGFRRKNLPALLTKYFFDMKKVMEGMYTMMRHESHAFIIIGNNSTMYEGIKRVIPTNDFIKELAVNVGFQVYMKMEMELLSSKDLFKNNRGSREQIIHLVKP